MLRLCPLGVVLTILLAGGVSSDTITPTITDEGGYFGVFVFPAFNHEVKKCILKTPHDVNFEFKPRDTSYSTDKYKVLTTLDCTVNITKLDSNDEGLWVMTYDHESATSQSYNVVVNVAESIESEEDEDAGIDLLSTIRHATRIGLSIDITLDKQSFEEDCYIRPPNGVLTNAATFRMNNVVVQRNSNFVSCRITIGPMDKSLLGEWRLCGSSTINGMRCQPANIVWNNNNTPTANWGVATQNMFSHPVHFGGSVNPGVVGTGDVESCHVITPNGEDLVIKTDVKYPHIERIALNRPTLCSINFTNIDSSSIGDWTIYGKFRSLAIGLNEVHLPLRFFLYNEQNPYEQAYNVTTLPEDRHLVILGRSLEVNVRSVGQVDNCQYIMPTGQSYDLNNAVPAASNGIVLNRADSTTACQITFSPITKDMLGEWRLIGKFSNGNQFTERRQTFRIIEEDPANPIIDDFRVVENLTQMIFTTELEASHTVTITSSSSIENESCFLLTPNGLQYAFIDGFNVPNVEIVEENGIECGVQINVESLDMLGHWTLIARATRSSTPIERRRNFTIRIEETSSLGNPITITEGADLYVSLPNATHMYDTCKLYGPNDEPVEDFEVDSFRYSSCGFTVRNITAAQRGIWAIVYGNTITYKATVQVNILELVEISVANWTWSEGNSVNVTLGPEDAVYCSVFDSERHHIFDGFGACRILLDRVTMALKGWWSIEVGVPGTVMLRRANFYVNVIPTDNRPVVTTLVARNGSSVLMTCSVPAENEIEACLFRDPTGNVLIASHGVGQDGYSGGILRYESDSESHDCTLRLLTPISEHIGIWRCAVDTASGTSYGFLSFSMDGINYNNNIVPRLVPSSHSYSGTEGKTETMSCSIDAALRYCYFRAPNGTVYNVGPSISSEDYEYVGNSLDAGECGIRFNNLWRNDSGLWSCNVGLVGESEERRSSFSVDIYERIRIYHEWQGSSVSLRLTIGDTPRLEYCRFVRIDGLAFMSDNVPFEYDFTSYEMPFGTCALKIWNPTSDDLSPWTVFAKAVGTDGEMSMTSTFNCPPPPQYMGGTSFMMGILLWTFFVILGIVLILAAVSLIPKKNREWTYRRASSIRNSFRKQPVPERTDTTMIY